MIYKLRLTAFGRLKGSEMINFEVYTNGNEISLAPVETIHEWFLESFAWKDIRNKEIKVSDTFDRKLDFRRVQKYKDKGFAAI